MENYIEKERIHFGHRSRMRAKLFSHGRRIFDTYELLEMLLYEVITVRDTNPIAKNLLHAFDGLDGVLSASASELCRVSGMGMKAAEYLANVGRLSDIIGAEVISDGGVDFSDYEKVGGYLADYFSGVNEKQVVAIFLDSGMRLLAVKKIYDLEYESGGVKAKPFIDEAIKCGSSVVITAHNHPFGPFFPTQGDRATNLMLTEALNMAGFVHAEHYIICGDHFAGVGSLKNFTSKLSQMPIVSSFITESKQYDGSLHRAKALSYEEKQWLTQSEGRNDLDRDYFACLLGYSSASDPSGTADILLKRYKTIENTLTVSARELSAIVGDKVAIYLKLLAAVTSRRKTDKFHFGKRHSGVEICEYLKALFLGESVEKTYIITYDSFDKVTGCELLGEGTVNASEILPRKALEAAVIASAASVSIAHNHPFGKTNPSNDDVNITKLFSALFLNCDITLKEHFIVAGQLCDTIDF